MLSREFLVGAQHILRPRALEQIEAGPNTASALDLRRSAYLRASATTDLQVRCVQTTYAHRTYMHLLITDFRCSNARNETVSVTLVEPGPNPFPAPNAEMTSTSMTSGIDGLVFSNSMAAAMADDLTRTRRWNRLADLSFQDSKVGADYDCGVVVVEF